MLSEVEASFRVDRRPFDYAQGDTMETFKALPVTLFSSPKHAPQNSV